MQDFQSKRVSFTLSTRLLAMINNVADYNQISQSSVVRMALLDYMRKPENELVADPESIAIDKMYESLRDQHPYLDPGDKGLIKVLYELKIEQEGNNEADI
jgi:hypothetical protein